MREYLLVMDMIPAVHAGKRLDFGDAGIKVIAKHGRRRRKSRCSGERGGV